MATPDYESYTFVNQTTSHSFPPSPMNTLTITDAGTTDAGNYDVTATNAEGCSAISNLVKVIVNPTPVPSITTTNPTGFTICDGSSITLDAHPTGVGFSYLWTPTGDMTSSITVSPTTNTTYKVQVTANGCTGQDCQLVTVVPCETSLAIFDCCARRVSSCDIIDYTVSVKTQGAYPQQMYR